VRLQFFCFCVSFGFLRPFLACPLRGKKQKLGDAAVHRRLIELCEGQWALGHIHQGGPEKASAKSACAVGRLWECAGVAKSGIPNRRVEDGIIPFISTLLMPL
jgi:hypothetical protein